MSQTRTRIIAAVGVSDEETAHLRLLMRQAAPELASRWRWGTESAADLLVIDADTFAGQMAHTRALAAGVRCAVFTGNDADPAVDAGSDLRLTRPLKRTDVLALLGGFEAQGGAANTIQPTAHFQFDPSLESIELSGGGNVAEPSVAAWMHEHAAADVAQGLDEWMRGDLHAEPEHVSPVPGFDSETATFSEGRVNVARSDMEAPTDAPLRTRTSPSTPSMPRRVPLDDSAHALPRWLRTDLLGGPAQIHWEGGGILSLDPKHQVFHCASGLSTLEDYVRRPSRRSDWHSLTSSELSQLREHQPAQPYAVLLWLHALLAADGKLSAHLDPGGSYLLNGWLEIRRDYPQQARIAAAMMQPARLHDMAATCNAPMSTVFAVVSAFDAIGRITWTPRPSRHAAEAEPARGGLLQRLRQSLKKD